MKPDSARVSLASNGHDGFISMHVRLPVSRLQEQMSAVARIGASATVNLHGTPERVISFITGLAGRYPAISARVNLGRAMSGSPTLGGGAMSASPALGGKTPVR